MNGARIRSVNPAIDGSHADGSHADGSHAAQAIIVPARGLALTTSAFRGIVSLLLVGSSCCLHADNKANKQQAVFARHCTSLVMSISITSPGLGVEDTLNLIPRPKPLEHEANSVGHA